MIKRSELTLIWHCGMTKFHTIFWFTRIIYLQEHPWATANNTCPLPSEEENCRLIEINDEELNNAVSSIPKLDTLILIKTMLKKHSFQNPFSRCISGRAPHQGGSKIERFVRSGRSNSAPGGYSRTLER